MASVTTPTIKKIVRLNSFDLLGTKNNKYMMYMCLDTLQLWYDESDSKRTLYAYVGVDTVNDMKNNIIPEVGVTYYCWESNSLWLWMNRWICLYTDGKYPSAYNTENNYIEEIYISDQNPTIVDNNGLLRDGSVVIRDANRVIKGRIFVSENYDNLVLSSFLGGGIRLLPNGKFTTDGELLIDDDGVSHIRGEWNVLNNEIYVDYTEKPEKDKSKYVDDKHRYKVWHEGNLKLEDLELNGKNILDKIKEAVEDGSVTEPLPLNVDKLDGKHAADFALKSHVHSSADISDFNEQAQAQANRAMMDKLTNMIFRGAKITWVEAQSKYMLSTDTFILAFTGGATGQGTVTNNTNTTIALEVDPSKHKHKDLEDRISALEAGGGGGGDLSNYYTKSETDERINNMFSTAPLPGKALLVDSDRNLPGNALTASDLNHDTTVELSGDITGSASLSYDTYKFTLNTSADKIVSATAEAGKALKLDNNKNLNANAQTASALNHEIRIELQGDVTGTGTLDTSLDSFSLMTTFHAPDYVLTEDDLGDTVASLDNNGTIYSEQLPEGLTDALKMIGSWSGTTAPTNTPKEGQVWEVSNDCTFSGTKYRKGDWIYYHNSSWHRADMTAGIKSINGKTGEDIVLDASVFNAVPYTYVDYTPGTNIPEGKAVVTDSDGHIAGATVDTLTNEFGIKTTGGDVEISKSSVNVNTNGSEDFNLKLDITEVGYQNIISHTARQISVNGLEYDYKKKLAFGGDIEVTQAGDILSLYIEPNNLLFYPGSFTDEFQEKITAMWSTRSDKPFTVAFTNNGSMHQILVDSTIADKPNGSVEIQSDEFSTSGFGSNYTIRTSKCKLTFDSNNQVTGFSIVNSTSASNVYITNTPSIYPNTNNTGSVGTSNNKWKDMYATTFHGALEGNASTATKFASSHKINNVAFDGSSDITVTDSTRLALSGGTMTGTISSQEIHPKSNNVYNSGTSANKWANVYGVNGRFDNLYVNGKRIFIQSGTPSGASNGDIWIVTK